MKYLIPIDGSELSVRAVRHALRLATQGLRIELVLANVQEPATVYEMVTLHDEAALQQVAEAAGLDLMARIMADADAEIDARAPTRAPVARRPLDHAVCMPITS